MRIIVAIENTIPIPFKNRIISNSSGESLNKYKRGVKKKIMEPNPKNPLGHLLVKGPIIIRAITAATVKVPTIKPIKASFTPNTFAYKGITGSKM